MDWESERVEALLRHINRQLEHVVELLKLLVASQEAPSYPQTTGVDVKIDP
jgi:hypothetical protein